MRHIIFCMFFFFGLAAQNISDLERKEQSLKEAVEDLKDQLTKLSQNEQRVLYKIKASDYQIRLSRKQLDLVTTQLQQTQKRIRDLEQERKSTQASIQTTRNQLGNRVRSGYKLPRLTLFEMLTHAASFDHLTRMMKYQSYINAADKRLIDELKSKQRRLDRVRSDLIAQRQMERSRADEQTKKIAELKSERDKQLAFQRSINRSLSQTRKAIKEKEQARANTRRLITELAKRSTSVAINYKLSKTFGKNRGRFPWPVKGKVTRRFGKVKHKKFNIYNQNDGIDIKAGRGKAVVAIHEGIVTNVFYQLGSGNTVIVDHGYGYFTVFAHLEEIYVKSNQRVSAGQTIATVGSSGTIDGDTKLHFEIWKNNKPVNPVKWLR